jgi:hypothetical protein
MACLGRDIVLTESLVKRRGPTRQAETLQGQVRSSHEIEPTWQSARGAGRSRYEERGENIETQDYRIGRNRMRTDFIAR